MLGLFSTFFDKKYLEKLVDEVAFGCQEITANSSSDLKVLVLKKFLKSRYILNKNKSVRLDVIRREIDDKLADFLKEKGYPPTAQSFIYMIISCEKYGLQAFQSTAEIIDRKLTEHKIDW